MDGDGTRSLKGSDGENHEIEGADGVARAVKEGLAAREKRTEGNQEGKQADRAKVDWKELGWTTLERRGKGSRQVEDEANEDVSEHD